MLGNAAGFTVNPRRSLRGAHRPALRAAGPWRCPVCPRLPRATTSWGRLGFSLACSEAPRPAPLISWGSLPTTAPGRRRRLGPASWAPAQGLRDTDELCRGEGRPFSPAACSSENAQETIPGPAAGTPDSSQCLGLKRSPEPSLSTGRRPGPPAGGDRFTLGLAQPLPRPRHAPAPDAPAAPTLLPPRRHPLLPSRRRPVCPGLRLRTRSRALFWSFVS